MSPFSLLRINESSLSDTWVKLVDFNHKWKNTIDKSLLMTLSNPRNLNTTPQNQSPSPVWPERARFPLERLKKTAGEVNGFESKGG